jgi:hypothetical protein
MRRALLLAALLAWLAPRSARATHFTITPGIEGTEEYKVNQKDCQTGETLRFFWTLALVPQIGHTYDWEIRSTTSRGTSCTMGSSTDSCDIRVAATAWDGRIRWDETYTVRSFFEGEGEAGCNSGTGTRKAVFFFRDNQPPFVGGSVEAPTASEIQFKFDFDPPDPPPPPTLRPGDQRMHVDFPGGGDAGTAVKHRVWWSTNRSRLTGLPACSGDFRVDCAQGGEVTASSDKIEGLTNGELIYVAISEIDDFGNESELSEPVAAAAEEVRDFFEQYAAAGGQERGGYCFIATAAYGSPWHPLVESLRRFRDRVLGATELGRDLISFYESWSPALAEVIADTPWLRAVFQVALAPVAVLAWFIVDTTFWEKLLLAALLYALWRLWRAGRRLRRAALAAAGLGALLFAGAARAGESPRHFILELKLGAIKPDVDARGGGVSAARPYAATFGEGSQLVGGFEFEWQILKDVGSFGVSFGALYFQSVGKGIRPDGTRSSETTVLNAVPLQANAVYRFDIPMRRYHVPLVPYAKLGFDYYLWWVLDGGGNVSEFTDSSGFRRRGAGGTLGWHLTFGLQFQLDVIDRRMAKSFDEDTGINHSYLFAEIVLSRVDDFNGRSLNLSANYFLAGLALEF